MAPYHRTLAPYIFLFVTGLYILVEAAYNVGLVQAISTPGISHEGMEHLETVGKCLAAIGVSMFIVRWLPAYRTRLFAVLAVILYVTFGFVIENTIQSLSSTNKLLGHRLGLYRTVLIDVEPHQKDVFALNALPEVQRRIALANIALLGLGNTARVDQVIKRFADHEFKVKVRRTFSEHDFDRLWTGYNEASKELLPIWQNQKGKTLPPWSPYAGQVMTDDVNGRLLFLRALKLSQVHRYRETVVYSGNAEYGIPQLTAGDIPPFMSRAALRLWVNRHIEDGRTKVIDRFAPDENTVASNPMTKDLSTTVFVPPFSMTLSQISLLVNLISFFSILLALCASYLSSGRFSAWGVKATSMALVSVVLIAPMANADSSFGSSGFEFQLHKAEAGVPWEKVWALAIRNERVVYAVASGIRPVTLLAALIRGRGYL